MSEKITELTTQIVVAYLHDNKIAMTEIPTLIESVRSSLGGSTAISPPVPVSATPIQSALFPGHEDEELAQAPVHAPVTATAQPKQEPFCSIEESIANPDYIICLEDGHHLQVLKRYIMGKFGLTIEQYKRKWGLPADYPTVSQKYSSKRSQLAKQAGLGRKSDREYDDEKPAPVVETPSPVPASSKPNLTLIPKHQPVGDEQPDIDFSREMESRGLFEHEIEPKEPKLTPEQIGEQTIDSVADIIEQFPEAEPKETTEKPKAPAKATTRKPASSSKKPTAKKPTTPKK